MTTISEVSYFPKIRLDKTKKHELKAKHFCPDCSEICRTQDRLLNHFLKHHVVVDKRKLGGGVSDVTPKVPESMLQNKTLRNNALTFSFPDIQVPLEVDLLSEFSGKSIDPFQSKLSPPLSIIENIAKKVDRSDKPVTAIRLDYGTFAWPDFLRFKDIFALKQTGREVVEEQQWLNNLNLSGSYEKPIDQGIIKTYIDLIQNSSTPVQIQGINYEIEDLKTLCSDRWLSMEMIMHIAKLLQLSDKMCDTIILNANNILEKNKLIKTICELQVKYGKRMSNKRIIFIMHVGRSDKGTYISSIGEQGNHFSMATYDIAKNHVVYGDSLAWPIPQQLKYIVNHVASCTHNVLPDYHVCHSFQCSNSQKCTPQCAQFYPRQKCQNACGVAVIIGMIMSFLLKDKYHILCASKLTKEQLDKIKPYTHLYNVTECSLYLRCCVISWIITGEIDINNISLKAIETTTKSRRKYVPQPLDEKVKSRTESNELVDHEKRDKREGCNLRQKVNEEPWNIVKKISYGGKHYEYLFNFSPLQTFLKRKPSVFYRTQKQKVELECLLINGTKRTKTFKVIDGIEKTLALVQEFILNSGAEWLAGEQDSISSSIGHYVSKHFIIPEADRELFYRCEFHHLKSSSHVRVTAHLLDGSSKYKLFSCNKSGYNDRKCKQEIQYFLDNEFREFLGEKWEELTKVPVGSQMREYIDKLPFNTRIKWYVKDHIEIQDPPTVPLVSLNQHPRWGKTNRIDSTFLSTINDKKEQDVVKIFLSCTSQTNKCKTTCGEYLHVLPKIPVNEPRCPNCSKSVSCNKQCFNCKTCYSSRWGKLEGHDVCNICHIYYSKHLKQKLVELDNSKSVKRHPHLLCKWKLKFVLKSTNLTEWTVYQLSNNYLSHEGKAIQEDKKMTLTDRDRADYARVSTGATPRQLELSHNSPLTVSDQSIPTTFNKAKLKSRFQKIDKHILSQSMGNGILPSKSQWENTEKILTQHHSNVLFFQRGNQVENKNYHIILGSDANMDCLSKYGKNICGYDIKHDFNEMRLKTGAFTYCDALNKGRVGAFTISNSETTETHLLSWQIILANLKCSVTDCVHERKLYVFNDGNGFVRLRPCVLENGPEFVPFMQHDKDTSLLNGAKGIRTQSSLCNFHGLQCIRDTLKKPSYRDLQQFMEPLVFGFKCIMRTYNPQSRHLMENAYIDFIENKIPNNIVPREEKDLYLKYLQSCWFESRWSDTYTAEVLYAINPEARKNPLVLTNNITERKFRDIDESLFNSKMNKLISNQVNKFINPFLSAEVTLTKASEKEYEKHQNRIRPPLTGEIKYRISKALELIQNDAMHFLPNSNQHGWSIVLSRRLVNENSIVEPEQNDLEDNTDYDSSDEDYIRNSQDEFDLLGQPGAEHSYSSISSAIRLVSDMKRSLSIKYKEVLMADAPSEVKEASVNGHVCNLQMGVCSCTSFIGMGQPKFCKHLFASMALKEHKREEKSIFEAYVRHIPQLPSSMPKPKTYGDIQKDIEWLDWSRVKRVVENSHLPSDEEKKAFTLGVLLSDLHVNAESNLEINEITSGRPKSRVAHRGGFRKQSNDKFQPSISMPVESRKRKSGHEQGYSQRKPPKIRKQDCGNLYNEQLQNLVTSKLRTATTTVNEASTKCEPNSGTSFHEKSAVNQKDYYVTEKKIDQYFPNNVMIPIMQQSAILIQQPALFQQAPMIIGQMGGQHQHTALRQVWLNINGVLQPAYLT